MLVIVVLTATTEIVYAFIFPNYFKIANDYFQAIVTPYPPKRYFSSVLVDEEKI